MTPSATRSPTPSRNPFEVPPMTNAQAKTATRRASAAKKTAPVTAYATIWKDPTSTRHGGLLTYYDGKEIALREEDEVARATNPAVHVLQDTPEDRQLLDEWLAPPASNPTAVRYPYLAVPATLVRDILGWDV